MRDRTVLLLAAAMIAASGMAAVAADYDLRSPSGSTIAPGGYGIPLDPARSVPEGALGRPARRVVGGPDYAGTEYGLGKPSFYGMAPRPDWGRSSID